MAKPDICFRLTDLARRRGVTIKGWREKYVAWNLRWVGKVFVRNKKLGIVMVSPSVGMRGSGWFIDFWPRKENTDQGTQDRKFVRSIINELEAWASNGLPPASICPTKHFSPDEGNAPETEKSRGSATGGE